MKHAPKTKAQMEAEETAAGQESFLTLLKNPRMARLSAVLGLQWSAFTPDIAA